eukprot:TRINITY_DN2097_c0_g1_i4.p1 TRINITY_DN2097_c0_g1~~TRINITY_DN2097_c0_g1_i4.p1  ORF type:complete len:229 (+),score=45.78 TRINITY_DN2097_c0_g1_i4:118-804(+)
MEDSDLEGLEALIEQDERNFGRAIYNVKADYSAESYWHLRYTQLDTATNYDCFQLDFASFLEFCAQELPRIDPSEKRTCLLNVGCGNSQWGARLAELGYEVDNVDCIEAVVERMRASFPHLTWRTMDARHLQYEAGVFGVVFDKGTFDGIHTGSSAQADLSQYAREVSRVLAPSGVWVLVSMLRHDEVWAIEGVRQCFELARPDFDHFRLRNPQAPHVFVLRPTSPSL